MQKKLNVPSKSILKKIYTTFANLYGMINWEDAFIIINKFFPDFTKKEFIKDLKNRADKLSIDYQIYTVRNKTDTFVIGQHFIKEQDMIDLYQSQGSISFWLPDTLDEYLFYSNSNFYQKTKEGIELLEWFKNHIPLSNQKKWQWIFDIYQDINRELDFEDTLSHLKSHELDLTNLKTEFTDQYLKFANNTKLKRYRGHSINELTQLSKTTEIVQLPDDEPYVEPKVHDESQDSQDIIWLREWLKNRRRKNEN